MIPPTIDVHLDADDLTASLRRDVRGGLCAEAKELPPKWFYDDRGCELFGAITRLPEYYPTRCEREILAREAAAIVAHTGADTLVELGSGTSEKTRLLLDALHQAGQLTRFVPFEVNETTLRHAADAVAAEYPGVAVHGVVGDFEHHLHTVPREGRRLIAFLGGTIGNLRPAERKSFLAEVAATMAPGDHLLVGTDLVKDPARLVAAYDDSAGITAEFNTNVLAVINRTLAADFDLRHFAHVARWDADEEWIEMRLRATADQTVTVADLDLTVTLIAGEEIRTEISAKFRRRGWTTELAAADLELVEWSTDAAGDFALSLATPT
ncbi:L-histidine N(alpha)-methyltransferase [soil metagenome]